MNTIVIGDSQEKHYFDQDVQGGTINRANIDVFKVDEIVDLLEVQRLDTNDKIKPNARDMQVTIYSS